MSSRDPPDLSIFFSNVNGWVRNVTWLCQLYLIHLTRVSNNLWTPRKKHLYIFLGKIQPNFSSVVLTWTSYRWRCWLVSTLPAGVPFILLLVQQFKVMKWSVHTTAGSLWVHHRLTTAGEPVDSSNINDRLVYAVGTCQIQESCTLRNPETLNLVDTERESERGWGWGAVEVRMFVLAAERTDCHRGEPSCYYLTYWGVFVSYCIFVYVVHLTFQQTFWRFWSLELGLLAINILVFGSHQSDMWSWSSPFWETKMEQWTFWNLTQLKTHCESVKALRQNMDLSIKM